MKPLSATDIRDSFVNTESTDHPHIPLPGLHEVIWEDREFLGWRDPRAPLRGYLVHWTEDGPIGIVVRASEARLRPGISAMCSLCHTPQPSGQVALFTAPKAGQAGREGNTVGTYICADLACSILIRIVPPPSQAQPDPDRVVAARAEALLARVRSFTEGVMRAA